MATVAMAAKIIASSLIIGSSFFIEKYPLFTASREELAAIGIQNPCANHTNSPSLVAQATSCMLPEVPVLRSIFLRWLSTVCLLILSRSPISMLRLPEATGRRTSISRLDNLILSP
jgi:hypothetical protein